MIQTVLRGLPLLVVFLVMACAHVPGPESAVTHTAQTDVRQWQIGGRFVAGQRPTGLADDAAAEPVAGRFAWQHQDAADTLWLVGPVGNTLAKIDIAPTGVRWQDATGKRGEAPDLRALGQTLAGIRLPDIAAESWLRGRWTNAAVQARDEDGRILAAGARGWRFEYRYGAPAPMNWPLAIEGAGPEGLWLRIALTEWDGVSDPADQPAP